MTPSYFNLMHFGAIFQILTNFECHPGQICAIAELGTLKYGRNLRYFIYHQVVTKSSIMLKKVQESTLKSSKQVLNTSYTIIQLEIKNLVQNWNGIQKKITKISFSREMLPFLHMVVGVQIGDLNPLPTHIFQIGHHMSKDDGLYA